LINGDFVPFNEFLFLTGIALDRVRYNKIRACYLWVSKKYHSEGAEAVPLPEFFRKLKKGSKKFRVILNYEKIKVNHYESLQQIKSFHRCTETTFTNEKRSSSNMSSWNTFCFPNRLKVFLFKYYNNVLGTGNRVMHIDLRKDPSCVFCNANKNFPSPIETFSHIFYDCPFIEPILNTFLSKYFRTVPSREIFFTGNFNENENVNIPAVLVLDVLRYTVWQMKLHKAKPTFFTIEAETLYLLEQITGARKKFKYMLANSELLQVYGGAAEPQGVREGP
jgi:hypothetical protein